MDERVNQWIKIDKLKDEKVSNQYGNQAMIRKLYYVVESRQCSTGEEMEAAWSELKDGLVGAITPIGEGMCCIRGYWIQIQMKQGGSIML